MLWQNAISYFFPNLKYLVLKFIFKGRERGEHCCAEGSVHVLPGCEYVCVRVQAFL